MEKLKPCPFCGCKYGMHEGNCYIYMLTTHERFDAVNHGTLFTDGELKKAWNTRAERTCKPIEKFHEDGSSPFAYLVCSECGRPLKYDETDGDFVLMPYCGCGAKVILD